MGGEQIFLEMGVYPLLDCILDGGYQRCCHGLRNSVSGRMRIISGLVPRNDATRGKVIEVRAKKV